MEDPWGLLASSPCLLGALQANVFLGITLDLCLASTYTCTHTTQTYAQILTQKHSNSERNTTLPSQELLELGRQRLGQQSPYRPLEKERVRQEEM